MVQLSKTWPLAASRAAPVHLRLRALWSCGRELKWVEATLMKTCRILLAKSGTSDLLQSKCVNGHRSQPSVL